jgi:hypothetical protein
VVIRASRATLEVQEHKVLVVSKASEETLEVQEHKVLVVSKGIVDIKDHPYQQRA